MEINYLDEFKKIYNAFKAFQDNKIPLCAAETYVSTFTKQALASEYEGKYIQGYKQRDINDDNIGSEKLYPLMCLVEKLCNDLFYADYADSRTLSGMNCIAIVISALLDRKKIVLISTKEMGGHPSVEEILKSYDIRYIPIPYDFSNYQVDYEELNKLIYIHKDNISFIIFSQSHILQQVDFSRIKLLGDIGVIYDASQTLGLIAGKQLENPLSTIANLLLIGGTHKTLPGPTCGLIMTNNKLYIEKIDFTISPTLLRNIQPNNVASLCLALIEQKEFGQIYQRLIVETANTLGALLQIREINVAQINSINMFTDTHQLFLKFDIETTNSVYNRAVEHNITLNKRISKLYTGIRLGVQEIVRYNYSYNDLELVAELFYLLSIKNSKDSKIREITVYLSGKKEASFVLNDIFMN